MDDSHGRAASRSELQNQIQHLQTVAIEASNQLRQQCTQVMQAQAIRLEDVAETEIEDIVGLDTCMDELMLSVLYTELRKEVRDITDALVDQQYSLFSSRKRIARMSPIRAPAAEGDEAVADSLSSPAKRTSLAQRAEDSEDDNPLPLSGADTFRTARGAPMFSSAESPVAATTADAGGSSSSDQPAQETLQKPAADPASGIAELERRLYDVCIEIDEWRRTRHIQDFVGEYTESGADAAGSGGGGRRRRQQRGSRPLSIRSAGLSTRLPIEQIIDEARERHRMRASSLGNAAAPAAGFMAPLRDAAAPSSNLMLSASPPLSRLMQAEREAADLRAT
ncbi:hypothetical protein GGF42_007919, partial [Coemansia sp. RSA 2424]